MRLAYVSYEYPPDTALGGIATYVRQAARTMAGRGWSVEVFAASRGGTFTVDDDGVTVHRVGEPCNLAFARAVAPLFEARHRESPFDVIEGPEYHADARVINHRLPGLPLVVKMHTPSKLVEFVNRAEAPEGFRRRGRRVLAMPLRLGRHVLRAIGRRGILDPVAIMAAGYGDGESRARLIDRLESNHARRATIVAAPCRALCEYARDEWRIDPGVLRLAPYPYQPPAGFLAIEPAINPEGRVVGFVGRLERRKGIEVLVRSLPAVCQRYPDAIFRFVGGSLPHPETGIPYADWIRRQLGSLSARCEFLGKVPLPEMHAAYAGIDVCVFPSRWENFPNVCLEAMAAARAIVGTAAGGMSEMLDGGRAGMVVPADDSQALAAAIIGLLADPVERSRLGEAARKRVLEQYNAGVIGAVMESIYREAIALSGARQSAPPLTSR